jgi:hypothetical protein
MMPRLNSIAQRVVNNYFNYCQMNILISSDKPYEVLNRDEIIRRQELALKQVEAVAALPIAYARVLLRAHRVI